MILKTNSTNPESLRKEVVTFLLSKNRKIEASNFNQMVYGEVRLNYKDPEYQTFACKEVCRLAKMYGVEVKRE